MFCRRWVDWKSIASELEATTHALQGQGVRARQVGDNSRVFVFFCEKEVDPLVCLFLKHGHECRAGKNARSW